MPIFLVEWSQNSRSRFITFSSKGKSLQFDALLWALFTSVLTKLIINAYTQSFLPRDVYSQSCVTPSQRHMTLYPIPTLIVASLAQGFIFICNVSAPEIQHFHFIFVHLISAKWLSAILSYLLCSLEIPIVMFINAVLIMLHRLEWSSPALFSS